jgi:hypothetical protein
VTSEFERIAWVWCENASLPQQPANPPSVGVAMHPHLYGSPWLRWREGEMPDLAPYDALFLNLFHTADSTHAAQIHQRYPDKFLVAMPDANLDLTLMHPQWFNLWEQIAACDLIAGRTHEDCAVYSAFFNKPAVWMPSPIYPLAYFAQLRDTPKADFILTQDHAMHDGLFMQNVAALALIQRETGMKVVYAAARDQTERYAELAGLYAEFPGHVPFFDFIDLTARARVCVDMYTRHSFHRQALLCAAVGTPMVGSEYSSYTGHPQVDPFNPEQALATVERLLGNEDDYRETQQLGYEVVVESYGAEACRRRLRNLLETYVGVGA